MSSSPSLPTKKPHSLPSSPRSHSAGPIHRRNFWHECTRSRTPIRQAKYSTTAKDSLVHNRALLWPRRKFHDLMSDMPATPLSEYCVRTCSTIVLELAMREHEAFHPRSFSSKLSHAYLSVGTLRSTVQYSAYSARR